ncbi:MAG: 1-acyl-sn-glycerol-3-phosphate acyltransferase [Parvularculaceae bacterium]|nr:1-acyl-sn-glycerol-3-phosphate acyltransferase [Parvularculaceae bacterium]
MTDDAVPPAARHWRYQQHAARPGPYRGIAAEAWRFVCIAYLRLSGWRMRGDWPRDLPRIVLVAAPHTSNWDGFNMLAAAGYYRVPLKWMGKKELTQGPMGGLVRWLGCIPVDRDAKADLVNQMKAAFAASPTMVLAVAPEGTRAKSTGWKSGFYHIAAGAGVPIVMSVLDYGTKTISISGALLPGGDYEADLALIKSHYETARGMFDERVSR